MGGYSKDTDCYVLMRKLYQRFLAFLFWILILAIGSYAYIWRTVNSESSPYVYTDPGSLPTTDVAVVLGAQVAAGYPSQILEKRLDAGISLYKAKKVKRLLMSGDGSSSKYYNEVKVMRAYAEKAGVASGDIDVDTKGLRTYDSCYRLKNVSKIEKPILISQDIHVHRAVYTCRQLGVDAYGESVGSLSIYQNWHFILREKAALVLAWLDVHFLHPNPTT